MTPLTVATVLRSGSVFGPEWVERLERQVRDHLPVEYRFVCLSDVDVPCERIPLETDWPGWWAKLEMWRPGTFGGRVLYFDLDTLIVDDISALATYEGKRAALDDFFDPTIAATGVLAFDGTQTTDAWEYITRSLHYFGGRSDHFLKPIFRDADRLQQLYPGLIGSYKAHHLGDGPRHHSVVCFHGLPKITDLRAGHWARRTWEEA